MWCFYIEKFTNLKCQLDIKEIERNSLQYKLTHTKNSSKTNELNKSSSSFSVVKYAENIPFVKDSLKLKEQSAFFCYIASAKKLKI